MNKPKHTPGPWFVVPSQGTTYIRTTESAVPGESAIAEVIKGRRNLSALEANARLIAAAPEMLAVLKVVERLLRHTVLTPDGEMVHDEVKAVIALAENRGFK